MWKRLRVTWFRAVRWVFLHELATVLLVLGVGAGTFGFIELADAVTDGESTAVDRTVLLALRNPDDHADPIGPHWFEEMARDVTAIGSVAVLSLFSIAALGHLAMIGRRKLAAATLVAIVLGTLVSWLMKVGFDRPRPDLVPHETQVFTRSFPSGHSAMSAVVFLTLGWLAARAQPTKKGKISFVLGATLLTLLIGSSRVYLGVHWPTDVLAGWTFGATWAAASWLALRWIDRSPHVDLDEEEADEDVILADKTGPTADGARSNEAGSGMKG
ncbi:phosphatase PAP2 family protein [Alienimonas californiensis]|uniref:Undecaprenyl pyrophosphate phosphatase n=1 Tax=Alienimonas californiensis TaxID=2527989 RepID=A0A517P4U8_9PLAN|nr:phosphatase PAP2 family protein [Alienimonas californiensis]QDT14403.1 undecaprenyl pyrophosphate phosphatase [Alienimonas californiensis]